MRFSPVGTSSVSDDDLLEHADEAVHVVQPVVLHVEGVASEPGALCEQHALRAGRWDVDNRSDNEGAAADGTACASGTSACFGKYT